MIISRSIHLRRHLLNRGIVGLAHSGESIGIIGRLGKMKMLIQQEDHIQHTDTTRTVRGIHAGSIISSWESQSKMIAYSLVISGMSKSCLVLPEESGVNKEETKVISEDLFAPLHPKRLTSGTDG